MWTALKYADGVRGLQSLTAVMGAILGVVVLGFFGGFVEAGKALPKEFMYYPVGLVIAIGLFEISQLISRLIRKQNSSILRRLVVSN